MAAPSEDNSHAGQGAVVLDIGGDVGALVVRMPPSLAGVEIEAWPLGHRPPAEPAGRPHPGHGRDAAPGHPQHVAVLARRLPDGGQLHSAVFAGLPAGTYELSVRPSGPVRLTVAVAGGTVTDANWPS